MKKKLNNRGISLLEVLVSVVILGIVVLPLLNSFVFSSRLNARSRIAARATEVAKNLFEGTKYHSISDLAFKCNYPTSSEYTFDLLKVPSGYSNVHEVIPTGNANEYKKAKRFEDLPVPKNLADVTSSISVNASTGKHEFIGNAGKKYHFYIEDIDSNGVKLNAFMKLTAKTAGTSTINDRNNTLVNIIDSMDRTTDVLIDGGYDRNIIADKMASLNDPAITGAVVPGDIKRTIEITILPQGLSESKIEAHYSYEYRGVSYRDYSKEFSAVLDKEVKNVYLLFFPWYGTGKRDTILVKNEFGRPVNVYLVKQLPEDTSLHSTIRGSEATYKADIEVREPSHAGDLWTKLITNIDTNIADKDAIPGGVTQGVFTWKKGGASVTGQPDRHFSEQKALDRLYEVEISIFDREITFQSGGAGEILQLPADKVLIEMKGGRTD